MASSVPRSPFRVPRFSPVSTAWRPRPHAARDASPCSSRLPAFSVPNSAFQVPRSGFTLIELLVVIAIIGILVTLITGAVQSVVRDRKIAQAKSEVQAIAVAAEEYYRTFKEIPIATNWYSPTAADGSDVSFVTNNNPTMAREFYNRLTGTNDLGKVFLTIQRVEGVNSTSGVLRDPWGSTYDFYLDSNYNGTVAGLFSKDCTVFVRSQGPNKRADVLNPRQSDDITWPPLDTIW